MGFPNGLLKEVDEIAEDIFHCPSHHACPDLKVNHTITGLDSGGSEDKTFDIKFLYIR